MNTVLKNTDFNQILYCMTDTQNVTFLAPNQVGEFRNDLHGKRIFDFTIKNLEEVMSSIQSIVKDSMLFNASKATNLIYRITPDLDEAKMHEINQLESYGSRVKWLTENGYTLQFERTNNPIFQTNLELIDSRLPEILAHLIRHKFLNGTSKLNELTAYLNQTNPCGFNIGLNPNFYAYKIKRLLVDVALGMKGGQLWTGTFNATGGFIIVKKDGELLCYHIYNWNDFQDYLLNNTKIDLPDSSPHRCDYGRVLTAEEVGEAHGSFMKLNFQIRSS